LSYVRLTIKKIGKYGYFLVSVAAQRQMKLNKEFERFFIWQYLKVEPQKLGPEGGDQLT